MGMRTVGIKKQKIGEFKGEYAFLSNFADAVVTYDGITYLNTEAAFQAQKTLDENMRKVFALYDPSKAKRAGRRVNLRPDWEQVKEQVMYEVVLAKFTQNEDLRQKLINTGDAYLEEGTWWNDRCWGIDLKTGIGENKLGKILMRVREGLKEND